MVAREKLEPREKGLNDREAEACRGRDELDLRKFLTCSFDRGTNHSLVQSVYIDFRPIIDA